MVFWEFPWIVCLVECDRTEGIDCTILSRVAETGAQKVVWHSSSDHQLLSVLDVWHGLLIGHLLHEMVLL